MGPGNPRPVSGEIMTGPGVTTPHVRPFDQADVLDAEYVTLDAPERTHPPHRSSNLVAIYADVAMLRSEARASDPAGKHRGGPAFWLAGLLVAAGAFWVSGGHAMFDKAPLSLPSWSEPLRIEAVHSRVETRNGTDVLFVDGTIANDGRQERAVPPITIDVAIRDGGVARYNLGTSGGRIAPGASFAFSSRFEAPMEGVDTVSVSFGEN